LSRLYALLHPNIQRVGWRYAHENRANKKVSEVVTGVARRHFFGRCGCKLLTFVCVTGKGLKNREMPSDPVRTRTHWHMHVLRCGRLLKRLEGERYSKRMAL